MAEKCSCKNENIKQLFDRSKCDTVLGAINDNAFHISLLPLSTHGSTLSSTDQCKLLDSPPLLLSDSQSVQTTGISLSESFPIRIFSDALPYYCVPMCGVYGLEDYELTDPLVLMILPTNGLYNKQPLFTALPNTLQQYVVQHLPESSNDILFSIIIHSLPQFSHGVDYPARHLNILFHSWAFKDRVTDEFDNQVTVQVGVFEPRGINQICNNDIPEELNGVPFNRLGPRIQYMHNMYSLSPHNCQMECSNHNSLCSFYSMAKTEDNRISLAYHILPNTKDFATILSETISTVTRLGELLVCLNTITAVHHINDNHAINVLQKLIEALC